MILQSSVNKNLICLAIAILAPLSAHAASEAVAYSFLGGSDGAYPSASLINVGGTLYGTSGAGGGTGCGGIGCGTVFKITPEGVESVVYAFSGGGDGSTPVGALINVGGALYGTTASGGISGTDCDSGGCGTVFSIAPDGTETTIHQFQGGSTDGSNPEAGLIEFDGGLYGTTSNGGLAGLGTVFAITTTGSEGVIYSLKQKSAGMQPTSTLVAIGSTLYGTAVNGGIGHGTVFKVKKDRLGKTIYEFAGGNDGSNPSAGLINVNGTLYGTTAYSAGGIGAGTIYSVSQKGAETVIYSLAGGTDGAFPRGSLINVQGTLYGTTSEGGTTQCECGTVFSVTLAGDHRVVYSFKGGSDGDQPDASLVKIGSKLYGTTYLGGAANYGTVFWVSP